jgi:hypothetical protein
MVTVEFYRLVSLFALCQSQNTFHKVKLFVGLSMMWLKF